MAIGRFDLGVERDDEGNVTNVKLDQHVAAESDQAVQVPEELQGGYRPNPLSPQAESVEKSLDEVEPVARHGVEDEDSSRSSSRKSRSSDK